MHHERKGQGAAQDPAQRLHHQGEAVDGALPRLHRVCADEHELRERGEDDFPGRDDEDAHENRELRSRVERERGAAADEQNAQRGLVIQRAAMMAKTVQRIVLMSITCEKILNPSSPKVTRNFAEALTMKRS